MFEYVQRVVHTCMQLDHVQVCKRPTQYVAFSYLYQHHQGFGNVPNIIFLATALVNLHFVEAATDGSLREWQGNLLRVADENAGFDSSSLHLVV